MKNLRILIFLLALILISCANNVKTVSVKKVKKNIVKNYVLPEWLNVFPKQKSYLIGFAHKTNSRLKMLDEAKQSASIFSCRNSEAYSVHKKAIVRDLDERTSRFDLNVSANISKVKIEDSCKIDDYYIYLFKNKKHQSKISPKIIHKYQVKVSSADLIDALNKGFDKIRTQMAEFHQKKVITSTTLYNERVIKKGEIKSLEIISGLNLSSIKISSIYKESNLTYIVEINMEENSR